MCGIIGYTGPLEADNILLNGLAGLEYRGYDSAGIAYFGNDSKIHLIKTVGKVAALKELVKQESDCSSHCGIGHTRWATHGGVTTENAHPHRQGLVTLIHNGIIENYHQLTEEYDLADHLLSQTDSEVAAGVLNALYERMDHDPLLSIRHFVKELQGSYGFCIMFEDRPGEIYAVRNVSPLVAAYTHSGAMIASDLTALIAYTKEYFVVPEGNIVRLTPYKVRVYDMELNRVEPDMMEVNWNVDAAMKNGFPHFMLKEIHEQPDALKNTILPRLSKGLPDLTDDGIPDFILKDCSRIHVIACGTAMHAGMVARALIEPGIRIPVTVSIASEFRYETPLIDEKTLVIVISQSGETIDTLAAMRLAQSYHAPVLAIVNVKGSTIARESDYVLYTHAGPEIAVATTKAYSTQMAVLNMLGLYFGDILGTIDRETYSEMVRDLQRVPEYIEKILESAESIHEIAKKICRSEDVFFIGRNLDYALSLEGSLKLKEISYIHSEAYASGELKHGTISLIVDGTLVIALGTYGPLFDKAMSNVVEVQARGANVLALTTESHAEEMSRHVPMVMTIPDIHDMLLPQLGVVPLQLLAYYMALERGCDIDKPRNLAKSVTVE